jgi:hypothetical protein
MASVTSEERTSIFLSHATPEDNEFTRWLAAKLTVAGYKVWYDLDRLKGGDYFWNKIENSIRNDCIRMIAIISENSYKKGNVQNEWDLGLTVEKQIPGFVIPIRIDGFDFSQLPITLHRKNVIDFNRGWHRGLAQLLDTFQDANLPLVANNDPVMAKAWLPALSKESIDWVERTEVLESNWLPIISLPSALETTTILGSERRIPETKVNRGLPWFEHGDQIIGFASRVELVHLLKESVMLRPASAVDTETFLTGGVTWGANKVDAFDARNRVATLTRQAWDLRMEKLGLKQYQLSNRQLIWYVPPGLTPKDKVEFSEANGKRRRKQLTGFSPKYKVNWHYAVSMRPVLDGKRRIELRSHIIFTDVGGEPINTVSRMHQLRRSFCKSWWNDRWRGFFRAFLALASQGSDVIELPVGSGRSIQVGAYPITFQSLKGLSDLQELIEDEDIQLDVEIETSEDYDDDILIDNAGEIE